MSAVQLKTNVGNENCAPIKREGIRGWMAWPDCDAVNPLLGMMSRLGIGCKLDKDAHYFVPGTAAANGVIPSTGEQSPAFAIALGLGPNSITHKILSLFYDPDLSIQYTCAADEAEMSLHDELHIDGERPIGKFEENLQFDQRTEEAQIPYCAIIARVPIAGDGRLFVCAGETAVGTQLASNYLAHQWTTLARELFSKGDDVYKQFGQYWIFSYVSTSKKLDRVANKVRLDCQLAASPESMLPDIAWTQGGLRVSKMDVRPMRKRNVTRKRSN